MKRLVMFIFILCMVMNGSARKAIAQKIGLLMDSYVIDRWHLDQKLFTDRIKELGGECLVEVPHGDPDEQVRLGKKLLQSGISALVIVPTDFRKAAAIVEAAKKVKIPVVSYDRMINTKDLSFYISYNNEKVGRLQAEYAIKKAPKGKYLLVNGPPTDNNAVLFRKGQLDVLQPRIDKGEIKLLGDIILNDWSEIEALMRIDEFLTTNDERPDVIIAANDALASGAIQAIPSSWLGKVVVIGQDAELMAMKNIINGNQTMTVYKPIKPLAYQAAEIAIGLTKKQTPKKKTRLTAEDYEVDAILLDPIVVDKANYRETVVKDGHVSMSEILGSLK